METTSSTIDLLSNLQSTVTGFCQQVNTTIEVVKQSFINEQTLNRSLNPSNVSNSSNDTITISDIASEPQTMEIIESSIRPLSFEDKSSNDESYDSSQIVQNLMELIDPSRSSPENEKITKAGSSKLKVPRVPKLYECPTCHKKFQNRNYLYGTHMNIHTGKKFTCTICNVYTSADSSNLSKHKKTCAIKKEKRDSMASGNNSFIQNY